MPSRASFATGRYVHAIGYWDNAFPYRGTPASWGHRLHDTNHRCDSIGKLHYRGSDDPNGFDNEILPLHVLKGEGDVQGMLRRPPPTRDSTGQLAGDAGPGNSTYLQYDRKIREEAMRWLNAVAARRTDKPWCLFISFVCPHFPLVAPPEFFNLYDLKKLPLPRLRDPADFPGPSRTPQTARGAELRRSFPQRGTCAYCARRLLRHGIFSRRQHRPRAEGAW